MFLDFLLHLNKVVGCELDEKEQKELINIFKHTEKMYSDYIGIHTINGFLKDSEAGFVVEEIDPNTKYVFEEDEEILPAIWKVYRLSCY